MNHINKGVLMEKNDHSNEAIGITKQLAEWICQVDFYQIPPEIVEFAKVYILDCIGVSLFGSLHENSKRIQSYVKSIGGITHASILGGSFKTSAPLAALANGYMAHVNDWDDTMTTMRSHPTATIFPAVLALGEMLDVSGAKIIESYIAGVEVAGKIGRGINPEHSKHWHAAGTLGCLGAAAGAAKIFRFGVDEM
jgi:2-methylcitrate dehydratase PrpD